VFLNNWLPSCNYIYIYICVCVVYPNYICTTMIIIKAKWSVVVKKKYDTHKTNNMFKLEIARYHFLQLPWVVNRFLLRKIFYQEIIYKRYTLQNTQLLWTKITSYLHKTFYEHCFRERKKNKDFIKKLN